MERCASCGRPRTGAQFCTGCGAPFGNTALPDATSAGHAPAPRRPAPEPSQAGRRLQMLVGLSALAAAGFAVTLVILRSPAHITQRPAPTHTPRPPATQSPATPSGSPTSATPSVLLQQQAAHHLAELLAQSAEDRSSVRRAVNDVGQCGNPNQDEATFLNAARSRRQLLSQLAPMRSALPGRMLRLLSSAWQASIQADDDFAKWAKDQVSSSCASGWSDPFAQAATGPDNQATTYKRAFTQMWNPLARRYQLTVYQPGKL